MPYQTEVKQALKKLSKSEGSENEALAAIVSAINGLKTAIEKPVVEVSSITEIPGDVLDSLSCGDRVLKVTGVQKHLYQVSYKGAGVGEGICLTYVDAGTVETVSYDYTVDGWVYNSTDHTTLTPDA